MYHSLSKHVVKGEDRAIILKNDCRVVLGIADGHGGSMSVQTCVDVLSTVLSTVSTPCGPSGLPTVSQLENIFKSIHASCAGNDDNSGTTLTLCIVNCETHEFVCANVGDSHCMLVNPKSYIWMSTTHRLQDNASERQRLYPYVQSDGKCVPRLYPGGLSCSRNIGDYDCVHSSHRPCVSYGKLEPYDALVLASDGLWDHVGVKKITNVARQTRCANSILKCKNAYYDDATIIVASRTPPVSRTSIARLFFRAGSSSSSSDDDDGFQKIPVPI